MKNYELLYILPASLTSEEIVKNFNAVQENIEKMHGKMLTTLLEHPFLTKTGISKDEESDEIKAIPVVKRKLAYPIKHEKFGFYCLVNFEIEEKKIKEIDEYLRLNNSVLRHIIVVADPMTTEELEKLQELFARKKAEQEKEEAESGKNKEDSRRSKRIEKVEEAEETKEEINEETLEETETVEEEKNETVEEKTEKKIEDKEEKSEDKKDSKKSKIKLEELEDKLDEILEDTIV